MIKLRNTTANEIIVQSKLFRPAGEADDTHEVPEVSRVLWANDNAVISNIADGSLVLSLNDVDITESSKAIDTLKENLIQQVNNVQSPFSAKTLPDGRKIFKRIHGVSATVSGAPDNIDFVIPYNLCKITAVEVINTELGDKINFKVFDTPAGTISGTPDALLNQITFDIYMTKDNYRQESNYDMELIKDLKLRIEYDAATSDLLPKTIYVNFTLHEIISP